MKTPAPLSSTAASAATAPLPAACLGQHWLIMGDINTGKTSRCRHYLQQLCAQGLGARICMPRA